MTAPIDYIVTESPAAGTQYSVSFLDIFSVNQAGYSRAASGTASFTVPSGDGYTNIFVDTPNSPDQLNDLNIRFFFAGSQSITDGDTVTLNSASLTAPNYLSDGRILPDSVDPSFETVLLRGFQ